MAYITENQLSGVVDLPICLPATDLRMGDWLTVAVVKVTEPMRLTYHTAQINLMAASVDTSLITSGNKIYGNLGLAYLTLRLNYGSGSPGVAGGLDAVVASALGVTARDSSTSVIVTEPGVYSWLVASNMQPSTDVTPVISQATSIDFRVAVTGSVRMELNNA